MLGKGSTMGVFSAEARGITNVVTGRCARSPSRILPEVVALFRPVRSQSIPRATSVPPSSEKVTYKHPLLEPILSVTYGCMIYQEQVMQVFQSLAGYSLGKADMVRRAMSKKKMKELEKERVNFIYGNEELGIDGAIKRGVPEAVAASLFDEIMDFANYAFNKAHAVCYAVVSFRTAYLKCHYPREYLAALLTSVLDVSDKISEYIQAARDMGIAVLPPDVNESYDEFSVAGENIRFGLAAVKGVGRSFMKQLVEEREANGLFTSFQDFCERMYDDRELNRRALESLIKAELVRFHATTAVSFENRQSVVDAIAQNHRRTSSDRKLIMDRLHPATPRLTYHAPLMPRRSYPKHPATCGTAGYSLGNGARYAVRTLRLRNAGVMRVERVVCEIHDVANRLAATLRGRTAIGAVNVAHSLS